jgi:hypothetical protein
LFAPLTFAQKDSLNLSVSSKVLTSKTSHESEVANDISVESQNAKAIHSLGTWHQTFGVLTIIESSIIIITGFISATQSQSQIPSGTLIIAVGGIDLGLGCWELSIGNNLKKFK